MKFAWIALKYAKGRVSNMINMTKCGKCNGYGFAILTNPVQEVLLGHEPEPNNISVKCPECGAGKNQGAIPK